MTTSDRRTFLRLLTAGGAVAALPESIGRALAIPANNRTGTIADIEHVVVLMQENRSFDHYYGTLRGVRGFGDPRPVTLPSGKSVWHQPNGADTLLPFHPTAPKLGLQFLQDLAHDWTSTHAAWNQGNYDQWVPNKGTTSMAHLNRQDIPFHYALADAFTICDAYHCSLLGPTDPNRYYMWTGWVGNDGKGEGPVIDNAESGYGWSTFPEKLQKAGVTWKIYQDAGVGLTASGFWGWTSDAYIGNYGDNSLLYFHQYQNAKPGNPLADNAKVGTDISAGGGLFDQLIHDVKNDTLPQVSWIVAPEAFTEHPNWPANYGAWYVSEVLNALTSNPEVWSKTVLFITFDENDGFFDHMVPPTVPAGPGLGKSTVSTANELFEGNAIYPVDKYPAGPYGLGVRVPMLVVSPWSKGGWVNSQVFDHTSIIQFIEQWLGADKTTVVEPNVTAWRRAVCGDLTSAFDFAKPNATLPALPSTATYAPHDDQRHADYVPVPPTHQAMPVQEPGLRFARALPYAHTVHGVADPTTGVVKLTFENTGTAGAWFQVRTTGGTAGPWGYTVGAGHSVADTWDVSAAPQGLYDLSVFGPNGFFRQFRGKASSHAGANLVVTTTDDLTALGITTVVTNRGTKPCTVTVVSAYTGETDTQLLAVGKSLSTTWSLTVTYGWYDLTVTVDTDKSVIQRLAGHVETGKDSASDPAIGGLGRAP